MKLYVGFDKKYSRDSIRRVIVAPPRLAAISLAIFFIFTLIPPAIYRFYINEPDLMFLDPALIIAFTMFYLVFLLGYRTGKKLRLSNRRSNKYLAQLCTYSKAGVIFLELILIFEIAIFIYSFKVLIKTAPDIYINFLTNNAQRTKEELIQASNGSLSQIVGLSMGTLWWVIGRWGQITARLTSITRIGFYITLTTFIGVMIAYSSLLASRFVLFPIIIGSLVVFYTNKIKSGKNLVRANIILYTSPAALIGLFLLFSTLRGNQGTHSLIVTLLGYGPASFNRFAAVLSGQLDLSPSVLRIDDFDFLFSIPFASRFYNVYELFGLSRQNPIDVLGGDIFRAGLDGRFNWAGTFGQLYDDLGLTAFPYVFVYGGIAALTWDSILRSGMLGQILYPWMAVSILFWFGYPVFFQQNLPTLVILAVTLHYFENVFQSRTKQIVSINRLKGGNIPL